MINTYKTACTEVIEILKLLSKEEYDKIPKSEIEFIEKNKDDNYIFNIDKSLPIEQWNISNKANAIIVSLWRKYYANKEQKEKLDFILKQNLKREEEIKKQKYNSDNLFINKKENNNIDLMVINKEKWYKKIYGFLKKIMYNLKKK